MNESFRQAHASTRLAGLLMALARGLWLALVAMAWAIALHELPVRYAQLQVVCAVPPCLLGQIGPQQAAALLSLGIRPEVRAMVLIASAVLPMLVFSAVAVVVFLRRADDRMAIFVALVLVTFAVDDSVIYPATHLAIPWRWPGLAVEATLLICLVVSFFVFPNGRFIPRWTRYLCAAWSVWILASYAFPDARFSTLRLPPDSFTLARMAMYGIGMAAQIYRFRRIASPVERQQTKWVVLGLLAAVAGYMVLELPFLVLPAFAGVSALEEGYYLAAAPAYALAILLVPISIGVSFLRYRLWDIDLVINRTLVYGLLTVLLIVLYSVSITALQTLFRGLTGQDSSLAIVLSTLGIAAVLAPLRRRVQSFIDHRFYRRQYDAAQVLAGFGVAARREVDLDRLNRALVAAVDETLHPVHVSLWLREGKTGRPDG